MECKHKRVALLTFLESGDIVAEIGKVTEIPFITENAQYISAYLKAYFGQRWMFSGIMRAGEDMVPFLIAHQYGDKWKGIIEGLKSFDNLSADYIRTRTTDEDINRDKTFDNVNKVASFNSDELTPDNGNDSTEDEVTKRGVKEREEYLSLKSMFDNLPMLEKYNILNAVAGDIANSLTLSIY